MRGGRRTDEQCRCPLAGCPPSPVPPVSAAAPEGARADPPLRRGPLGAIVGAVGGPVAMWAPWAPWAPTPARRVGMGHNRAVSRGIARAVIALALAGTVLWFGLPLAASAVAGAVVSGAGLEGDGVVVSVEAMSPLKLLLLEADAVHIRSGPATFRGARFQSLDVRLLGLSLGAPPRAVAGRLDQVEFTDGSGVTMRAESVELSGAAEMPQVRIEISPAEVSSLLGRALPRELAPAATVALSAPDGVRIATAAGEISARLVPASDGSLELVVSGPGASTIRITVLTPGPALPLTLSGAGVEGGALVLRGTLDASSLGL